MTRLAFLPLLIPVVLVAVCCLPLLATAQDCAGPYNTLTSDCRGAAHDSVCIVFDRTGNKDTPCNYNKRSTKSVCVSQTASCAVVSYSSLVSSSTFKFFVVMGGYFNSGIDRDRDRRLKPKEDDGTRVETATSVLPYEIDQFVDNIGPLKISSSVTNVVICGGQNEFGDRGKVASVAIDPGIFSQSPHLSSVALINLNIGGNVASIVPSGVAALNLRNTLLTAVPNGLSTLKKLSQLILDQNSITTFQTALPGLTELSLAQNRLSSFTATLLQLVSLDISDNALVAIPETVYNMTKLRVLKLAKNPVKPLVLTQAQYNFLSVLEEFTVDNSASTTRTPADGLTIKKLRNIMVVVLSGGGGSIPVAGAGGTQPKTPSKTNETSTTTGDSSSTSTSTASTTDLSSSGSGSSRPRDSSNGGASRTGSTAAGGEGDQANQGSQGSESTLADGTHSTKHGNKGGSNASDGTNGSGATKDGTTGNSSTTNSTASVSVVIGLAIAAAVLASFVAGGFIFHHHRRRQESGSELGTPVKDSPMHAGAYAHTSVASSTSGHDDESDDNLASGQLKDVLLASRVHLRDIEDLHPITSGGGGSSVTWLVRYRGARVLVSKRLIEKQSSERTTSHFINEVLIASKLDHPSIVALVGVAWTSKTDLQALFEHMPQGDLRAYLDSTSGDTITRSWDARKIRIAIDVMEALVYTHSFDPPLLHRDLKAKTVLLSEDFRAKLSDFGDARYESEDGTMTASGVGTARWLAPEILCGSTSYTASCDIYAFGVLLTELDTHQVPYDDVMTAGGSIRTEMELLQRVARGGLRPSVSPAPSSSCPVEIRELAMRCMAAQPSTRPSALQVVFELRKLFALSEYVVSEGALI